MSSLEIIILAAGKGSRMKSILPKVLQPLAGEPLLAHVLKVAHCLNPACIHVVYGFGGALVRQQFSALDFGETKLNWVEQPELLGTGHAVKQVLPFLMTDSTVLVLYGDVPLISQAALTKLKSSAESTGFSLLTTILDKPEGYGRIIRAENGGVRGIVEDKDATHAQREITEINTGFMAFQTKRLAGWLSSLDNDNAQKEYYLTDLIEIAVTEGMRVMTVSPEAQYEVLGVNDRCQLAKLERILQKNRAEALMREGVMFQDPERFDLRGSLRIGQDVMIDIGVIFEGDVVIGDRVKIGPYTLIKDSTIGEGAVIASHSVIESSQISSGSHVGPFARLRPGTVLEEKTRIGNFVEIKKTTIGVGSKVNHLSYIGDSDIGRDVNIGAGTITCNYDGANKHKTHIGDNVFVGSCTQLVAPVSLGDGATIGAGSTITRDVPAGDLALSRSRQQIKTGWLRPSKQGEK